MSALKVVKKFKTQKECIEFLENKKWKDGVICPYCKSTKTSIHNEENRTSRHQCQSCQKSFSVLVGTIFEASKLPLVKWFMAIALIIDAKKGISSLQISRHLDFTYKTAWFLSHKIRKALEEKNPALFGGVVELDETYVKTTKDDDDDKKGGTGRGTNNTAVFGIVNKGGDVKAFAVDDTKSHTLLEITMNNVELGTEIHTDEYKAYKCFKHFYTHKSVFHKREYVSAEGITTNSVEGFWSLLKRGIKGNFHHISKKYLQAYINEFSYRYNARKLENVDVFNDVVARLLGC